MQINRKGLNNIQKRDELTIDRRFLYDKLGFFFVFSDTLLFRKDKNLFKVALATALQMIHYLKQTLPKPVLTGIEKR